MLFGRTAFGLIHRYEYRTTAAFIGSGFLEKSTPLSLLKTAKKLGAKDSNWKSVSECRC